MATQAQIAAGLDTRLATISGLRHWDRYPDTFNPPGAWVEEEDGDYPQSVSRLFGFYRFAIVVAVQASNMRIAQTGLRPYIAPTGSSSIVAAIVGDRSLGGLAGTAVVKVLGYDKPEAEDVNGVEYWATRVHLEVQSHDAL